MVSAEQINQVRMRLICDLLNQATISVRFGISYVETGSANPSVSTAVMSPQGVALRSFLAGTAAALTLELGLHTPSGGLPLAA